MTIRALTPADLSAAIVFLRAHIQSSLFMLGNLERVGCEYKPADYHGQYWASFTDSGTINGLIAHNWNGNVMVQAPDKTILHALQQHAFANITRPIGGFIGVDDQVDFLMSCTRFVPDDYAKSGREDLFALPLSDLILPTQTATLIRALDMDESLFIDWIIAYDAEALGYDHTRAKADADARWFRIQKGEDMYTLMVNNTPVSLCGLNSKVADTVQVGPVWTPPEHRGHGYARTAVGMMLDITRKSGVQNAVLFTENPAASRAYTALGFKRVGGFKLALLRKQSPLLP